jgi:hypothetical protein
MKSSVLRNAHRAIASLAMAMMLSALPLGAAAHDIPNDVRVQAFVKPAGSGCNCSSAFRLRP